MRGKLCPAALLFAAVCGLSVPAGSAAPAAPADEPGLPTSRPSSPADRSAGIEASLRAAMRRPVSIDVVNEPLDRTIATLSRRTFVPVNVDWDALGGFGIEPTTRVTLRLSSVPADRVLTLIFRCANRNSGASAPTIGYDAGGVRVPNGPPKVEGSEGEPAARPVEVAYDVSDLLRLAPRWLRSREQCYDDLTRLIEDSIASDTWRDNGGAVGQIRAGLAKPAEEADDNTPPPPPPPPRRPGQADPLVVTTAPEFQAEVAALLSGLRRALAGQPTAGSAAYERTSQSVGRPIPASFKLLPLEAVLETWRRSARVNLFIDWNAMEAAGVKRSALITLPAPASGALPAGQTLAAILKAVEKTAEEDGPHLAFEIDSEGVVIVSTADAAERTVETRCYGLQALLNPRRSSKLWSAGDGADVRIDAISKAITDNIDSDSWKDTGGTVGSIHPFAWVLVISQTPHNHDQVAALLRGMP